MCHRIPWLACGERLAIDVKRAAQQMHIGLAGWIERQLRVFVAIEQAHVKRRVSVQGERILRSVR